MPLGVGVAKETNAPNPPDDWPGSKPEYAVFWALERLGLKEGEDFTYQVPLLGGRMELGGTVADFYIHYRSLVINVQSIFFHYANPGQKRNDQIIRSQLESMGIMVVFIDEEDALRAPIWYTSEALKGIDHSRMRR